MKLVNKITDQIICKDLKVCESFIDRMFGLLIPGNPRSLMFKTRFGIHTFFLKEEIDVLVLDSLGQVVDLKQDLKPNRLFFWNPKFSDIIELKAGTVKKFRIKVGPVLKIS